MTEKGDVTMQLYSIMNLDIDHIDEICEDIKKQVESGVATMALFLFKLVPEGNPFIDKASITCENYDVFRDRLKEMGIECGVLVQCTIGHGYKLNQMPDIQMYTSLTDGQELYVGCPTDEKFKKYIFDQMATIAKHKPAHIMVDDDLRLLQRPQKGCACPNHLKLLAEAYGEEVTREDLYQRLTNPKTVDDKRLTECFVKTQQDSVLEFAKAIRAGIDSVDPSISGSYCGVGTNFDSGVEVAEVISGKGHPVTVRINNGMYTAKGARELSNAMFRAASQVEKTKHIATDILAETDTCPQLRYSTGAATLHSHFVASILEGCTGAKHWITRLIGYEPEAGLYYRKKLAEYRYFYEYLASITKELKWLGARLPVSAKTFFDFTNWETVDNRVNNWAECVLERFGLPMYYSSEVDGCTFMEGKTDRGISDEDILSILSKHAVLSCEAAKDLINRGFGEYIGVDVREWEGPNTTGEMIVENKIAPQNCMCELVPFEDAEWESYVYHLRDGIYRDKLFPGVTTYKNKLGGLVHVFAGVPKGNFDHVHAFSMLNSPRKKQIIKLLKMGGNLPVYYPLDSEILLKAAITPDDELMVAYFNISLDCDDKMYLVCDREFSGIKYLDKDGKKKDCKYEIKDGVIVIDRPSIVLHPEILFIK